MVKVKMSIEDLTLCVQVRCLLKAIPYFATFFSFLFFPHKLINVVFVLQVKDLWPMGHHINIFFCSIYFCHVSFFSFIACPFSLSPNSDNHISNTNIHLFCDNYL